MPRLNFPRQALSGLGDIPLTAIVGSDLQNEAVTTRSHRLRLAHCSLQLRMETRTIANDAQADVVFIEAFGLAAQCLEEQIHQGADFIGRPLPVLTGEGKQGQHLDLGLGAHLDHRANSINTRFMPGDAGHEAFFCPAIVAIHDDRDMARHRGRRTLLGLVHLKPDPYTAIRSFSFSSVALAI